MPAVAASPEELIEHLSLTVGEVAELDSQLEAAIQAAVDRVTARSADGVDVVPVVEFSDVAAATVSVASRQAISESGCVVVRGTFPAHEARAWDAELGDYLERNSFEQQLSIKYPAAVSGSGIWPIYWSRPQVQARQHPNMVAVRRFVNSFWRHASGGVEWFDPSCDIAYADRVRRRRPGARAAGLAIHNDSPSAGGWRLPENQKVFAPLLRGGLDAHDAWSGAHRTGVDPESTRVCSVFRTFQGWTALSDMDPSDGVLNVVPIPDAMAYRLVRGLAAELGARRGPGCPAPARDAGDELVAAALVPIPAIEPGDTVWWHGDLFHSVGAAANRTRWGNVMYIGSSPACARNDAYRPSMYPRFVAGVSPVDFPPDEFEHSFTGRAGPADLNAVGRQQFGVNDLV